MCRDCFRMWGWRVPLPEVLVGNGIKQKIGSTCNRINSPGAGKVERDGEEEEEEEGERERGGEREDEML